MAWRREEAGMLLVRKPHRPGQVAGVAVAAPVQQTAEPPDRVAQREPRSAKIGESQIRQPMLAAVPPEVQRRDDDGPDDRDAAGPYLEHVHPAPGELVPIQRNIE